MLRQPLQGGSFVTKKKSPDDSGPQDEEIVTPEPTQEPPGGELVEVTLFPAMPTAARYCQEKGLNTTRTMVRAVISKADYVKLHKEQSGSVRLGR